MNSITILGNIVELTPIAKGSLKGLTVGDTISYYFYKGSYHGINLLFIEPKASNPSPKVCSNITERIGDKAGMPVVFIFTSCPAYERQRLVDKDVFFVVSDKFAHLPMLIANERVRKSKPSVRLSPVAQYILLYHLEVESLEGLAARDLEDRLPYSYESITLGLTCLTDVGLSTNETDGKKRKLIRFKAKGRELWEIAQSVLSSPVEKRLFCDELLSDANYPTCGINALAHYSWLNPDSGRTLMLSSKELRQLIARKCLIGANELDGDIMLEVWKYPPVSPIGTVPQWVDRLSVALSFKDDPDPRVEGEVERIIKETERKH